jgi:hypothetical protein
VMRVGLAIGNIEIRTVSSRHLTRLMESPRRIEGWLNGLLVWIQYIPCLVYVVSLNR